MKENGYIIIEGNIGAGKSTLAQAIVNAMQNRLLKSTYLAEPDEKTNPFLKSYYAQPNETAFKMQMHLLSTRYISTQAAQWGALSGLGWFVMDRSYFGDLCFANVQKKDGYFTNDEFNSYVNAHKAMQTNIHFPTAAIFLKSDVQICRQRIDKRISEKAGRKCESGISLEYLSSLQCEINKLQSFMENHTTVIELSYNADLNKDQIDSIASGIVDRLTNTNDNRNDFFSPWGACSNVLFNTKNIDFLRDDNVYEGL